MDILPETQGNLITDAKPYRGDIREQAIAAIDEFQARHEAEAEQQRMRDAEELSKRMTADLAVMFPDVEIEKIEGRDFWIDGLRFRKENVRRHYYVVSTCEKCGQEVLSEQLTSLQDLGRHLKAEKPYWFSGEFDSYEFRQYSHRCSQEQGIEAGKPVKQPLHLSEYEEALIIAVRNLIQANAYYGDTY